MKGRGKGVEASRVEGQKKKKKRERTEDADGHGGLLGKIKKGKSPMHAAPPAAAAAPT